MDVWSKSFLGEGNSKYQSVVTSETPQRDCVATRVHWAREKMVNNIEAIGRGKSYKA